MKYVYLLESAGYPEQNYVGSTDGLRARLQVHNTGGSPHTSKYKSGHLVTYVVFSDEAKATAFARYMKTASGRAFATKRLRRMSTPPVRRPLFVIKLPFTGNT